MPASSLVSLITISNNLINNHLATAGQIITITSTYNSTATSISGTLNGNALSFTQIGSTPSYVAHYTVISTDTQGIITLSVHADTVTSTAVTNGNPVSIDTIAPSGNITYTTTGTSLNVPVVGDVHTMNIEFTEPLLSVPRLGFGYLRASKLNNTTVTSAPTYKWVQLDTYTWQATYKITGNEIMPHSIQINVTDLAGNIGVSTYSIVPPKLLDYYNYYYYYDEFINDNLGRYYTNGTGAHSIVSPLILGENGIGRFTATGASDYSGYNISKNYLTFLYQSYNWLQLNFYLSDLGPSVSGDTANIRVGFIDSDSSTPNYGFYFESDLTNNRWKTCVATAGAVTSHSIVNTANVLKSGGVHAHLLTITYDGINAYFYLDGVLIDTIAYFIVDPIGSGVFPSLGFYIIKASGTTQVNFINVDYIELTLKRNSSGDFNSDFSNDFFN